LSASLTAFLYLTAVLVAAAAYYATQLMLGMYRRRER
jgi:hypothetical protein